MLKAVLDAEEEYPVRVSPPQFSTPARCESSSHDCRWQPYANAKDFEANAAMILIILFCALISALILNAVIRCFLSSRRSSRPPPSLPEVQLDSRSMAAADKQVAPPTLVFSSGMKLAGAEAECAICLSEFVEGEGIRVMGQCKHGFHVQCIQEWLSSHSSCPTCRGSCLPTSAHLPTKATGNEPLEVWTFYKQFSSVSYCNWSILCIITRIAITDYVH